MVAQYQLNIKVFTMMSKHRMVHDFLNYRFWLRGINKAELALIGCARDVCPDNTHRKSWHQGK